MGVVRRKRGFRDKMVRRQVPAGKGAASHEDAASAWGSHLEDEVQREQAGPRVTVRRSSGPAPLAPVVTPVEVSARQMARRLAAAQGEHEASSGFDAGSVLPDFARIRPFLAVALLALALGLGVAPVWGEASFRRQVNTLNKVMEAEAARVAAEHPELRGWLRAQRLSELRALYEAEVPHLVEALEAAGFSLQRRDVAVRVDFQGGGLILSAILDAGDRDLSASAHTAGLEVGRPPPPAGYGAALGAHLFHLLAFVFAGGILSGALWIVPAWRAR